MSGGIFFLVILFVLAFIGFIGFIIYFIFKQMQFVFQAVDLYKAMVLRLDKIIEILSPGSAPTTNVINPLVSQAKALESDNNQASGTKSLPEMILNLRDEGFSYYLISQEFNEKNEPIPERHTEFKSWSPELIKLVEQSRQWD